MEGRGQNQVEKEVAILFKREPTHPLSRGDLLVTYTPFQHYGFLGFESRAHEKSF